MIGAFEVADVGKRVVTTDGNVVGSVVRIDEGEAYVRPDPAILAGCGSWVASYWDESATYKLNTDRVHSITDEFVVIEQSVSSSRALKTVVNE